jgi:hypothetical protein
MISPRCFEVVWIREQAAALQARDLRTLEKNILALELVSRLRREGLEFIFKGGTSLALFFDPVRRLSIDVDILSLEPIERLKALLDAFDLPAFLAAGIDLEAIRDASLDGAWTNLNRLKQTDPKAFECWHQAQLMRTHQP